MSNTFNFTVHLPDWAPEFLQKYREKFVSDEERMSFVLDLLEEQVNRQGGGPFSAAVFAESGELVAVGVNRVVPEGVSIAHAEVMAVSLAQKQLQVWDLGVRSKLSLFSSAEMCTMCCGALLWSGVKRVVYAARREDVEGEVGFDEGPEIHNWISEYSKRGIEVLGEFQRERAVALLRQYRSKGGLVYNPG